MSSVAYAQLRQAVSQGQVDRARELLNREPSFKLDGETDSQGNALLHWAASNGQRDVCRMLLDRGAFVDVRNHAGITPIHLAAEKGLSGVAGLLAARGASLMLTSTSGLTALAFAVANDRMPTAHLLVSCGSELPANLDALIGRHTFPPLGNAERQLAADSLVAARTQFLADQLEATRLANWTRRKALLMVLSGAGFFKPLSLVSPPVSGTGIVVSPDEARRRRLLSAVLGNRDLLRIVVAFS